MHCVWMVAQHDTAHVVGIHPGSIEQANRPQSLHGVVYVAASIKQTESKLLCLI